MPVGLTSRDVVMSPGIELPHVLEVQVKVRDT